MGPPPSPSPTQSQFCAQTCLSKSMEGQKQGDFFPLDRGFVLHQPLCCPQCPNTGIKEALAEIWDWQILKRWAGAARTHRAGGSGGEHRRGEAKE